MRLRAGFIHGSVIHGHPTWVALALPPSAEALMGHFTKLIDYMAPSLWNFIKCINGEFFGWEADSKQLRARRLEGGRGDQ